MRTLVIETGKKIGTEVTLCGWVNTRRDHGRIVFIDLRDRSGLVQMVLTKDLAQGLGVEDVLEIRGLVKLRPEKLINPKLTTGKVEIEVKTVKILNKASESPSVHHFCRCLQKYDTNFDG